MSRLTPTACPCVFVGYERPIGQYTRALADARFVIEEFREPQPSADAIARVPRLGAATERPWTLLIRARLVVEDAA